MGLKTLEIGKKAPSFTLKKQNGEKVALKDFKDKKNVVLYFYPKAMTPGCTVQAQGLRNIKEELETLDTVVLGVSIDSVERLDRFIKKEDLNFDLLSDEDHKVAELYGSWVKKKNFGKEYMGILRSTFFIDKKGKLTHVMDKVKTKTHHESVLEYVKQNF